MRKTMYLFFSLFIIVLLTSCSKEEENTQPNEQRKPIETEETFESVYPLTGMETNAPIDNRIVSVMVNNHTKARPQSGLAEADIVFEILAEGPITRFLALYHSNFPDVVGPVRSAREYYFTLAQGYDALYVYHGAADFINDMIVQRGVDFLNGSIYDNDGYLFKRESFRVAPHNSYLQLGTVYDVANKKGYETTTNYETLPFLSDEEVSNLSGDAAKHIEIVYSDNPMEIVEFEFVETTGKYLRYNDREQTVELDSGNPIQVDNVFIVETHHEVIDAQNRRYIDLESGGNAYLIQKGVVQYLEWENQDGRIIPVKDGEVVEFAPGQTWINVIPTNPGIDQSVRIVND